MKTIKGKSVVSEILHGEITKTFHPFYDRSQYILLSRNPGFDSWGYKACITTSESKKFFCPDFFVVSEQDYYQFEEGDYVSLQGDRVSFLWEINNNENSLLLTESCNCSCLMCPQPPRAHDPFLLSTANAVLDSLKNKKVERICLTGGEPTILKDKFIAILKRCCTEHPKAYIYVLTNAKLFSDIEYVREVAKHIHSNIVFCVSLHSDLSSVHDEIVGVKRSHEMTEKGIYNLGKFGIKTEIRHVITKQNYTSLKRFVEYLYAYFPFAVHYYLMGMEVCGEAKRNFDTVYVPPHEYKEQLKNAVLFMQRRGMPVSVYNIPLCLCDEQIRHTARQSISQWKNIFLSVCDKCNAKSDCAGFFATSSYIPKHTIQPLKEDEYEKNYL